MEKSQKGNLKVLRNTYRVSLAIKVYANFETKEIASSEREAIEKALEKYENGEYGIDDISEPDWVNSELDIGEDVMSPYSGAVAKIVSKNKL